MPERNRYNEAGEPLPCVVRVQAQLARFLYRETIRRGFRDETELLNHIVRIWAEDLDEPMNWPEVLKMLKEEEGEGEGEQKPKKRGRAG